MQIDLIPPRIYIQKYEAETIDRIYGSPVAVRTSHSKWTGPEPIEYIRGWRPLTLDFDWPANVVQVMLATWVPRHGWDIFAADSFEEGAGFIVGSLPVSVEILVEQAAKYILVAAP